MSNFYTHSNIRSSVAATLLPRLTLTTSQKGVCFFPTNSLACIRPHPHLLACGHGCASKLVYHAARYATVPLRHNPGVFEC